jgi:hypothetical protein
MSKLTIKMALDSESAVANPFLYADGLLNFDAVTRLQVKVAASLKAAPETKIVGTFVTKRRAKPVKYSAAQATKADHKYLVARATKVVLRKRLTPESLARVAVLLQLTADPKFAAAFKQAQVAVTRHQKKCETILGKVTKEKGKIRDAANATFDKSVVLLRTQLASLKPTDIVESMGMMGKSVVVRLGPDNYVTVGKADKARFAAATKAAKAAA